MKDLRGGAAATVPASRSDCFALLAAIERYPKWHPQVVRRAEVTERDAVGWPTRASATVHLGIGPLQRDFDLNLVVSTIPDQLLRLSRMPHDSSDPEQFEAVWQIGARPATRLSLELRASLDVPRLMPLRGVGDSVAEGFVAAARAELERARART